MIKTFGMYEEFGDAVDGTLKDALKTKGTTDKRMVEYLRNGVHLCGEPSVIYDVLVEGEKEIGTGPQIRTDGKWVWNDSVIYYIESYGLTVPVELEERAMLLDYEVPQLSEAQAEAICDELEALCGWVDEDEVWPSEDEGDRAGGS